MQRRERFPPSERVCVVYFVCVGVHIHGRMSDEGSKHDKLTV